MTNGSRNRPLTPPPAGTGAGIASIAILAGALPAVGLLAASGWSHRGLDLWLDNLAWCAWPPMALVAIPAFGWGRRRFWAIAWYWILAVVLTFSYPLILAMAAAIPLGIVRPRSPDPLVLSYYALGFLLCLSPFVYLAWRLIRLRYWQPWTSSKDWEKDLENAPKWAVEVTSAISPGARQQLRQKGHAKTRPAAQPRKNDR